MDIVIIGAGIGGLSAAALLLQRGHRVRVVEQAAQLGEIGAGIQMSANAVKVLDAIGLRARFELTAVRPLAFEFRRFDSGELLHTVPLGAAHERQHGAPYFQIHRHDLHQALLETVRSADAAAVQLAARGAVRRFADGAPTLRRARARAPAPRRLRSPSLRLAPCTATWRAPRRRAS